MHAIKINIHSNPLSPSSFWVQRVEDSRSFGIIRCEAASDNAYPCRTVCVCVSRPKRGARDRRQDLIAALTSCLLHEYSAGSADHDNHPTPRPPRLRRAHCPSGWRDMHGSFHATALVVHKISAALNVVISNSFTNRGLTTEHRAESADGRFAFLHTQRNGSQE